MLGNNSAMDDLLTLKTWLVAGWFILLFALERWFSSDQWPDRVSGWRSRLASNGALWVLNAVLSAAVVLPITAWSAAHGLDWRPGWWQGLVGLPLDLLLLDMAIYGWHVANHRVAVLWRFHEVHHLDEFLDVTSAVRFHFGEVMLSALARGCLIILMDVPFSSVLIFEMLVLLAAIFHHSNLSLPVWLERPLSWLVVTPSIHWVHHHAVRAHTDSNYATILSVWDRLFRTRSTWQRRHGMKIGVAHKHDQSLIKLLIKPFRV